MRADSHSVTSNETNTLKKLGVEVQDNRKQNFASVINRIIEPSSFLSDFMIVVQFIQFIIIGICPDIEGFLKNTKNLRFLDKLFIYLLHPAVNTSIPRVVETYILNIFGAIDIIWLIFYILFSLEFAKKKTFNTFIVKSLYYIGYDLLRIIGPTGMSTFGYFFSALYNDKIESDTVYALFSIIVMIATICIQKFLTEIVSASPNIDIKDVTINWPLQYNDLSYRIGIIYFLPFIVEFFRDKSVQYYGPYAMNIICSIIGIIIISVNNSYVFFKGRAIAFTLYSVMLLASVLSIVYHIVRGISYIYIAIFIVVNIAVYLISYNILNRINRKRVDILYLKEDDIARSITTSKEAIDIIYTGIFYNAPCIANKSILSLCIHEFPSDSKLLMVISFIYYIMNVSYQEILKILSEAVDITPLTNKQKLLFYQIFKRLPTHEHQLTKKIDGIKRMYSIPKASLAAFWDCIIQHQWDEALTRSYNFSDDLDKLNQIFATLMFDNPASDIIIKEYINFADNIQGNHIAANRAQVEINRRLLAMEVEEDTMQYAVDQSSQAALSKLSSIKSSIYISEFSENTVVADRVSNNIQTSFLIRPLFWPTYFFNSILVISLFSIISIITVFAITSVESNKLDRVAGIAKSNHEIVHKIAYILELSMQISSNDADPYQTITGKAINVSKTRNEMVTISHDFDVALTKSFDLYADLPKVLRAWVDSNVTCFDSDADITADTIEQHTVENNMSLITAIRIYQLRAITIAFSPENYIGTVKEPSPDSILLCYMYPAAAEVTKILNKEIVNSSGSNQKEYKIMYIAFSILVIIDVALLASLMPIVIIGFIKEYNFFVSIVQSISAKSAKKMLLLENQTIGSGFDENYEATSKKKISFSSYKISRIVVIFVLVFLITPLPIVLILFKFKEHQIGVRFIVQALKLSSDFVADFGYLLLYCYRIVSGFPSPYTLEEELKELNASAESTTRNYRELFFGGTDQFPEGILKKFPDMLDSVSLHKCKVIKGPGQLDPECMAFQEMVFFIFDQVQRLCSVTKETLPNKFNTTWWRVFYPIANSALTIGIQEYYDMLNKIVDHLAESEETFAIISLIIGIILFFIAILGAYIFKRAVLEPQIRNIIKPLMLIPPNILSECNMLIKFLQGEFDRSNRQIGGRDKNRKAGNTIPLIDFIYEGILAVNPDGTIIGSNSKYHELMKNTPEDVLGLNVRNVLPMNIQPLFDVLEVVKNGNSPQTMPTIETDMFTEDDQSFKARVSLIVNMDDQLKQHTCAFIIFDKSELIKAQELLRKEKANVENLLDSILPHNIAVSLLNGKTDISFEAERGLVLFSDLVSFTPMCSKMSAKQIMMCLNLLFTSFDNELAKYKRVTKLKTIGDAYVCATGIFEGDGPLELAAAEIVQFSITMQKIIPQINKQYGFSLKQRVGVHCGGPLICGVLGKEKPLFEVIGSTVDLAEELESTCVHCKVHISEAVYELIRDTNIRAIERTDIKVDSIGTKTYTINP